MQTQLPFMASDNFGLIVKGACKDFLLAKISFTSITCCNFIKMGCGLDFACLNLPRQKQSQYVQGFICTLILLLSFIYRYLQALFINTIQDDIQFTIKWLLSRMHSVFFKSIRSVLDSVSRFRLLLL